MRAASVTCFAGITSSVFFSLMEEKQDFILSSLVSVLEPVVVFCIMMNGIECLAN